MDLAWGSLVSWRMVESGDRGLTFWNKSDVFTPCYGEIGVFARASKPGFNFLEGNISAKEFSLRFSQRGTCFDEIDVLDARCQRLEVANDLH